MNDQKVYAELTKCRINLSLSALYLLLNLAAGYGYMMSILAYYYGETYPLSSLLCFGLANEQADWYGNLLGDAAWTVEPALIMVSSPILDSYILHRSSDVALYNKKSKTD